MKRVSVFLMLLLLFLSALPAATPWQQVAAPVVDSIESDGESINVNFTMITGSDGADKGRVLIYSESGSLVHERAVGRSKRAERSISFDMSSSGSYYVVLESERKSEEEKKVSEAFAFSYSYPLYAAQPVLKNIGSASFEASFNSSKEAEGYIIALYREDGTLISEVSLPAPEPVVFSSLEEGVRYYAVLTTVRGEERVSSEPYYKTARSEAEREWSFTYFGQSVKKDYNYITILDSDDLTFSLNSCSYDSVSGTIGEKGGKFTAYHDGISYYYTEYDPALENWELTATFTIDYINPSADGQEGFGILAMDSLGEYGVSAVNHYTNSAGIIATKFEETIAGSKKTSKDTLGARFVTGLSEEIINGGDELIAQNGKSVSHAYSYDSSDLVKAGDVYRITLKKDNTGYHAIYRRTIASEDTIEEYTLYGPEKLEVIDPEHSYVGFAVARGCNVTVSDIVMTVTDPATDAPAQAEPAELVPLQAKIDSPSSSSSPIYQFVFTANCDGTISVTDNARSRIIRDSEVKANTDYNAYFFIERGVNDYYVTFTPDPEYRPGENMVMAAYDKENKVYYESYAPVSEAFSVSYLSYDGDELYVSSDGTPFGDGSRENPLDLDSALRYLKPGQKAVLKEGTYFFRKALIIERGNSGRRGNPKTLTVENGGRAVFNFAQAGGGMQLWGDWWVIENIDITNTDGNVKGLQVAGDYNVISRVNAYDCGDTGIQISGTSTETYEKWPHDNLIISCVSHDNRDPADNNADGFAAKLTVGDGNVFRYCIGYSNIDDGWDLFSKIESGPIGAVLIDSCIAYGNGSVSDGSGNGDGNGFKLGGDGIAVRHVLRNSLSYENGKSGVTSNSNPALVLEKVTSVNNAEYNITLYGKGSGERDYEASKVLSVAGGAADSLEEELSSPENFFCDGAAGVNSEGVRISLEVFRSTDSSSRPEIKADGTIEVHSLYQVDPSVLTVDTGAIL